MKELTDLEICQRIAEIEEVKYKVEGGKVLADTFQVHDLFSCAHMGYVFNPLTDDALCFQLHMKHKVRIRDEYPDYMFAQCKHHVVVYASDEKPNKAILLAIIKASEQYIT